MIPRKIHFIFGMAADFGGKPFGFFHWVAVKSAKRMNPTYQINLWLQHIPEQNYYFDELRNDWTIHVIEAPQAVFDKPLHHVAHRSDVLRLQILLKHGGVYLDLDTLTVGSFDGLLSEEFVIAEEVAGGVSQGLGNCVMACRPGAAFAAAWLDSYVTFRSQGRDQFWVEHSVEVPKRLADTGLYRVRVLDSRYFLQPDWTFDGLCKLFIETHEFPESVVLHLW